VTHRSGRSPKWKLPRACGPPTTHLPTCQSTAVKPCGLTRPSHNPPHYKAPQSQPLSTNTPTPQHPNTPTPQHPNTHPNPSTPQPHPQIGPGILKQVSESYRKLRGTLRFLLGSLADFDPSAHAVAYGALPGVDRFVLGRHAEVMGEVREAYETYQVGGGWG